MLTCIQILETMDLAEQFKSAQEDIQKLTERPSNDELLNIYALFKQATEGDNENPVAKTRIIKNNILVDSCAAACFILCKPLR